MSQSFALDGTIKQAQSVISGLPFESNAANNSDLWADMLKEIQTLQDLEVIDKATADQLRSQGQDALVNYFQPAYENIIRWAENAKDKAPEVATGINAAGGAAYYEYRLRNQTTTDLTANEIHQIGLDEVARLRKEMETVKESVDFRWLATGVFQHVRDGEWNYYPDTDEGRQAYIDDATAAIDGIKAELPNFFGLLPKADLVKAGGTFS